MMRLIGEVVAAALTATALYVSHAKSEPLVPDSCVTMQIVEAKMAPSKPAVDLQGAALDEFNANFKQITGHDPAKEADHIVVYGNIDNSEGDTQLLFLVFSKGCIIQASLVPSGPFLQIYRGNKA